MHKNIKLLLFIGAGLVLVFIYKVYNPGENILFPKCPFRILTGLQCPGCGSQRAIHHLLNFELAHAFMENPMMVLSIPYILGGFILETLDKNTAFYRRWRSTLYGSRAILIVLMLVLSFWVVRNIPFPNI